MNTDNQEYAQLAHQGGAQLTGASPTGTAGASPTGTAGGGAQLTTPYRIGETVYNLPADTPEDKVWEAISAEHMRMNPRDDGKKTFIYYGETYVLPGDMSDDEAWSLITEQEGAPALSTGPTTPKQDEKTWSETVFGRIDPDDLQYDKHFVDAGRTLWEYHNGKSSEGVTDKELSEYALSRMGWFQYNMGTMGVQTGQVVAAPDEYKKAFLHILNVYDDLEFSRGGLERFAKGVATDPTTYFGIASFGAGTAAAQTTKVTTIAALKQLLRHVRRQRLWPRFEVVN